MPFNMKMLNLIHYKRNQNKRCDTNFSLSSQQRFKKKKSLAMCGVCMGLRKPVGSFVLVGEEIDATFLKGSWVI